MSDKFPIFTIQPEWIFEPETLGSKEKFWYRDPVNAQEWLFKYPEENTGQHWAEKIAAEVAYQMEILHAPVELAVFGGVKGSTTASFIQQSGKDLFHGNQILAGQLLGYQPQKRFKQSDHTLDNIFLALDKTFLEPEGKRKAKARFVEYLVLDAVIGNTDRHHENWGILRERRDTGWVGRLAPTFDHASSLGRELRDNVANKICRHKFLNEKRVGVYAEKAQGAIYWETTDRSGLSPLGLIRRVNTKYPGSFQPAINKVKKLDKSILESIINMIPADWMTPLARQFALELMCYNIEKLSEI